MGQSLKDVEFILKDVYLRTLEEQFKYMNYQQAIRYGWKRPRHMRIRWADVQKNKVRKFIHYEKLPHKYIEGECLCWRCRLYRRIDCW